MNSQLPGAWRVYGRAAAFVLTVLFAVGVLGHAWEPSLPLMITLTPWFGLVTGVLVFLPSLAADGSRLAIWAAATYAFTFLAEAAGVATGAVFGDYQYGPTMGLAWMGVPVLIAFNWVLVVHGCFCIARRVVPVDTGAGRRPVTILLTGLLAMGFDYLMEPVAIRLDYWTWAGGDIPLQNYVAWFLIAALAAGFHPKTGCVPGRWCSAGRLAAFYVAAQAVFFIALRQVVG